MLPQSRAPSAKALRIYGECMLLYKADAQRWMNIDDIRMTFATTSFKRHCIQQMAVAALFVTANMLLHYLHITHLTQAVPIREVWRDTQKVPDPPRSLLCSTGRGRSPRPVEQRGFLGRQRLPKPLFA
jgi:hypothetical protein